MTAIAGNVDVCHRLFPPLAAIPDRHHPPYRPISFAGLPDGYNFIPVKLPVMKYLRSFLIVSILLIAACSRETPGVDDGGSEKHVLIEAADTAAKESLPEDTLLYAAAMRHVLHGQPPAKWRVMADAPLPGALLPFHRIVAYYGNLYSRQMGILGALQRDSMLSRLKEEAGKWQAADTVLKVMPALHYVAVTAQRAPGRDRMYRLRMPFSEIDKIIEMAGSAGAIVFLDIQPGHSLAVTEARQLARYLALPFVHLGIDPEYSMKNGEVPCSVIGTMDASDINEVSGLLAEVVRNHGLPPKVLVVHRFTQAMVTNYRSIILRPEVQIVMNMDGFGGPAKKRDSYRGWITGQPVQFTGFKLFYLNDVKTGGRLMQPEEVLQLFPSPVYIQYQ